VAAVVAAPGLASAPASVASASIQAAPDRGAPPCVVLTRAASPSHTAPAALRMVTFNVHYGADLPALARAVAGNPRLRSADVFLLQEIEQYPGDDRPAALARALDLNLVYAPARPAGRGTHGLAILSRWPLRDLEVVALPHHDLVYGTRRRIALGATLDVGGQTLRVYNVHLDTRLALPQRMDQLEPVAGLACAHARAVVGGDLNTITSVAALLPALPVPLPGFEQGPYLDRFMRAHGFAAPFESIGATGPLGMRLDAFYVKGARVSASGKEDSVAVSDHVPLWMDVDLD
jgi:endonuclease/exonuclease/phosphatase family metal-dependent hydrolase